MPIAKHMKIGEGEEWKEINFGLRPRESWPGSDESSGSG